MRFLAFFLLVAGAAQARTLVVHSGGSIRAALAQARPGDTVEVQPGVYREGSSADDKALTVTTDGIRLVGRSSRNHPVVLENAGSQRYGVWASPRNSTDGDVERPPCGLDGSRLHGFSIQGFTLRGFAEHGLHLACVAGFRIEDNVAEGNHVYGIFPVLSQDGSITGNFVTGTDKDAAIYVGQSDRVVIAGNRAEGNLLGLEVENSRHCAVLGNELSGNTLGILVDILPDKITPTQETTLVSLNSVHDNNRPNTAEPDDILAVLPAGIGVLLSGADSTAVTLNELRGNQFAGIAVVSLCLGFALQGQPELCGQIDVEPNPDQNRIAGNVAVRNGTAPTGTFLDALLGDLVWDGSGNGNCWSANRFGTAAPSPLPACR